MPQYAAKSVPESFLKEVLNDENIHIFSDGNCCSAFIRVRESEAVQRTGFIGCSGCASLTCGTTGGFRDIQAREKEREDDDQRWFGELLQNAKDSVTQNDKVQVKVDEDDNLLSFSHTGHPVELDDIMSLIIQGSSTTTKHSKVFAKGSEQVPKYRTK